MVGINRKFFYGEVRKAPFGGKLSASAVNGMEALLDVVEDHMVDDRKLAYILGTAFHETAFTMCPIVERGPKSYFNKYEPGTRLGKRLGNVKGGDGYLYRGRGYVQITGRENYRRAGAYFDLPLVEKPDLALVPHTAAGIILIGMTSGWFTGKPLFTYINDKKTDFINARRVVNGTDKAAQIASYARKFLGAIAHG